LCEAECAGGASWSFGGCCSSGSRPSRSARSSSPRTSIGTFAIGFFARYSGVRIGAPRAHIVEAVRRLQQAFGDLQ
jgi:hypothetical protein